METEMHNKIFLRIVTELYIIVKVFLNSSFSKLLTEESNKKKLPEKLRINATEIQNIAL
jgi:hypothetical protein